MKHFWIVGLICFGGWSCTSDQPSLNDAPYNGPVRSVSVESFQTSPARQSITDSLPEWLPIEEYSKTFNEKGQLVEQTIGTLYSTAAPDTLIYKYDEEGKLFEKSFRSAQLSENRLTKYMYNVDDQMNAINVLLPDGDIDSVFLYNYDSEGTLRSINEFHNPEDYEEFVATLIRKYFYTVKNMIRIDHYRKNPYTGKHYYAKRIIRKYRPGGELFEEKIESGGTTIYKYEYNNAGLPVSILTYDGSNQLIEKTSFEYDEYGNTMLKTFQSDVGSYSYRCEYTYDDQQNWTEKKIFIADGEEPSYVVQRTFTYQS
jgi:YD repeat-containing protein